MLRTNNITQENSTYSNTYTNASKINIIKRGEVYLADLHGSFRSEQGGVRPVLIVQNDIGNKYSPCVMIVPLTSKTKNKLPTHITLDNEPYLTEISIALVEQIRTIDKARLIRYMGKANENKMDEVDIAIEIQSGIKKPFDYDKAFKMLESIARNKKLINKFGNDLDLLEQRKELVNDYRYYCNCYNELPEVIKDRYIKYCKENRDNNIRH